MTKAVAILGIFLVFLIGFEERPWFGTGIVTQKEYDEVLDCHLLKITDQSGEQQERCVSERVWYDAMLDHQITITKEYN